MEYSFPTIVHVVDALSPSSKSQIPYYLPIDFPFILIAFPFRLLATEEEYVEEAIEASVIQIYLQVFHHIVDYLKTSVFHCFFECFLDVPEHYIMHILCLVEDLLE